MFESHTDASNIAHIDHTVFWVGIYITPVVWLVLGLAALFRLNFVWEIIVVCALVLSFSNVYGYLRCAKGTDCGSMLRSRPSWL